MMNSRCEIPILNYFCGEIHLLDLCIIVAYPLVTNIAIENRHL